MSAPIVIATLPKNRRERFQASLVEWQGRTRFDLRTYYDAGDDWRPSKEGVSVPLDRLTELANAVNAAVDEARSRGMLEEAA